jgi:hypothetical protein
MTSLFDLYVKKEHPLFDTLTEEQKETARNIFIQNNSHFKGRASYAHFKHLFGTFSKNTFTITSNEPFSIRNYIRIGDWADQEVCDCITHIKKNELVGAQYNINLENL